MKSMTMQATLTALTLIAATGIGWADTSPGSMRHAAMTQTPSFDQVDTNKDGSITRDEAGTAKVLQQDSSFTSADQNKDGKLSKTEYDAAMKAQDRRGG
ncbi:MAG: EF-hand domain-containing protein [Gammaproteobacteria bacterium]|nr:EF-hand domain-containing protein [Gammaproteobacteria bacterium]